VIRLLPPLVMSDAEARMVAERLSPLVQGFLESASPPLSGKAEKGGDEAALRHFLVQRLLARRARVPLRAHQGPSRTNSSATSATGRSRTGPWPMIFEKPRPHAHVVRVRHAPGSVARRSYLYTRDSQLGRGEPVEDAAQ